MKIKTPTEFQTFTSGICYIYTIKQGKLDQLKAKKHYGTRSTSYKRYYAAKTAGTSIDLVIHVPLTDIVSPDDAIVIKGKRYSIVQLQKVDSTNPPVLVLSLRKAGAIS